LSAPAASIDSKNTAAKTTKNCPNRSKIRISHF
jgi:hypothetical protein